MYVIEPPLETVLMYLGFIVAVRSVRLWPHDGGACRPEVFCPTRLAIDEMSRGAS